MCGHPSGDWFSKVDVDFHYCRIQVVWMIRYADLLDFSIWPPKQSGYIDQHADIQKSPSLTSPHQATIETWSEVYARLQGTGRDGKILWDEVKEIEDIKLLSQPSRDALNYVSGYRRRRMKYADWKKQRKYRMKDARKV
jgi:hypothetical protein